MATEEVVSRKVIGSANPIARKFRDVKSAFAGVGCGFLALVGGLALIFYSVTGVEERSQVIELLDPISVENVDEGQTNLVEGKLTVNEPLIFEDYPELSNLLYYEASYERFEPVKKTTTETRTVVENGQDVQETVEVTKIEEEWVEKQTDTMYTRASIGDYTINLEEIDLILDSEEKAFNDVFIANLESVSIPTDDDEYSPSSNVGDTRIVVTYVSVPDASVLVAGEFTSNEVKEGDIYLLTDKSRTDLIESLKSSESTQRWGMRIGAWLLLTIGFGAIIAPIMEFVEMIPIFGNLAKTVAGIIGAILAAIIVFVGVLVVKYWYICLGGGILLIILAVIVLVKVMGRGKN